VGVREDDVTERPPVFGDLGFRYVKHVYVVSIGAGKYGMGFRENNVG